MFGVRSSVGGGSTYELQADDPCRRSSSLLKEVKLLAIRNDDNEAKVTRINTYGGVQPILEEESSVLCCESCNHRRRAIVLQKAGADCSWGFTLQSYGVQDKQTGLTEVYTYVDYVDFTGAAFAGGLRKGDVIIALNGKPTQGLPEDNVVNCIRGSSTTIRMVVVSCDICRRVELHTRLQKLKEVLELKQQEIAALEKKELEIVARAHLSSSETSAVTSL